MFVEKKLCKPRLNIYGGKGKAIIEKLRELVKKDKGLVISHLEDLNDGNVDFLGEEVINYYYLHDLHLGKYAEFSS